MKNLRQDLYYHLSFSITKLSKKTSEITEPYKAKMSIMFKS